jgi:hypothetical protein
VEGTPLFVPVWKPGALVYTGNSHVAQGDGEVNLTAIKSAMRDRRIQVVLHQRAALRWPLVEMPTHWIPLSFAPDLNATFRLCLRNTIAFLSHRAGLTPLDVYGLCSVAVSFRVTQVVDVSKGVHAMISKDVFVPAARQEIHPLRSAQGSASAAGRLPRARGRQVAACTQPYYRSTGARFAVIRHIGKKHSSQSCVCPSSKKG